VSEWLEEEWKRKVVEWVMEKKRELTTMYPLFFMSIKCTRVLYYLKCISIYKTHLYAWTCITWESETHPAMWCSFRNGLNWRNRKGLCYSFNFTPSSFHDMTPFLLSWNKMGEKSKEWNGMRCVDYNLQTAVFQDIHFFSYLSMGVFAKKGG